MVTGKFASVAGGLAVMVVLATVSSCARAAQPATPTGSPAASRTCPAGSAAEARAAAAAGVPAAPAGLIRRGAAGAVICQYYAGPAAKATGMLARIALGAAAADGLAALVDDGAQVASPPRCDAGPLSQFITFAYQSGPAVTASFATCEDGSGAVMAGGRAAVISGSLVSDLFSYTELRAPGATELPAPPRGPNPSASWVTSVPDVTGLSPAAAVAAARGHGGSLTVDGAAFDSSVPFATVIFQAPPPVTASTVPAGTGIGAIIAVRPEPACTPAQLALAYRGGGAATGNDFGSILFRDTGQDPCSLAGTVSVTGLNAAGAPVTATVSSRFAGPGVLSPRAPAFPVHGQLVPGELLYQWMLAAEYRDGPASGGTCTPDWVIPVSWRVTLPGGGSVTVPNRDPADPVPLVPGGGLVTCEGHLGMAGQPSSLTS